MCNPMKRVPPSIRIFSGLILRPNEGMAAVKAPAAARPSSVRRFMVISFMTHPAAHRLQPSRCTVWYQNSEFCGFSTQ